MSYRDFDINKVKSLFNLDIIEHENLFADIKDVEISESYWNADEYD